MKRRLSLGLLLLVLSPMSAALAADIGLSPARLDLVLPRGASITKSVSVLSTFARQQPLSVAASDWLQNDQGALTFLPSGQDPYSATAWLGLPSDAIAVPPNGSADYRFTISVPKDPSLQGTYKTVLFFETQASRAGKSTTSVRTRQRVGLVIYLTIAGTARPSMSLSDFYRQGKKLVLVTSNAGNVVTRLGGDLEIRDRSGKTVDTLPVPDVPVQRGGVRNVSFTLPSNLASGVYVALALVKPSNAPVVAGQLQFTVP